MIPVVWKDSSNKKKGWRTDRSLARQSQRRLEVAQAASLLLLGRRMTKNEQSDHATLRKRTSQGGGLGGLGNE